MRNIKRIFLSRNNLLKMFLPFASYIRLQNLSQNPSVRMIQQKELRREAFILPIPR